MAGKPVKIFKTLKMAGKSNVFSNFDNSKNPFQTKLSYVDLE